MPYISIALVGLAQVIGIGSLFYAYPTLATAIAADFGHPVSWLFGCLTATILLGALPSPWIGRLIDRHGGYRLVAWGSVLASASLLALGLSTGIVSLTLCLLAIQIASGLTLYEAMFPTLMQIDRVKAHRLITEVALFGGLSSTAFWPLTQFLFEAVGWRNTLFIFAAMNLLICTPIYALTLRGAKPIAVAHRPEPPSDVDLRAGRRTMIYLTAAICLISFSQQSINYDLVPAFVAHGLDAGTAAAIGAVIGPSTVAARLIDIAIGGRIRPMTIAVASIGMMSVSFFIPTLVPAGSVIGLIAFAVLFGLGQGIFVIARGTLPLNIFGPVGYGARLGVINAYRRYLVATAPFLFALAIEQFGVQVGFVLLAIISLAGFALLRMVRV